MLSRLNRAMPTNAGAAGVARPRTRGVTPFVLPELGSIKFGATGAMPLGVTDSVYGADVLDSNLRPTDSAGETTG